MQTITGERAADTREQFLSRILEWSDQLLKDSLVGRILATLEAL